MADRSWFLARFLTGTFVPLLLFVFSAHSWAANPIVRVAVLKDTAHFVLSVDGRYVIRDLRDGREFLRGSRLKPISVEVRGGKLVLDGKVYGQERILVEPRGEVEVGVNRHRYRGSLLVLVRNGRLTAVNRVDLEQYVRGVLYHEISDKWPMEAMKAQAVATRTFAAYSLQQFASRDYDMTSDVYSQVYGGRTAERYRTNLAVRDTSGQVLVYKGRILPAFFHSNSGGMTEDASELWDIDLPPLKGGVKSIISEQAPHARWKKNFRLKDIQDRLLVRGIDTGVIREIAVSERNSSGRVRKLTITNRQGQNISLDGKIFRDAVGPNELKSNWYEIVMQGWYVDFEGRGWGHGVGMCQWGAYGLAGKKYSYRQILDFYYPGSGLARVQDLTSLKDGK